MEFRILGPLEVRRGRRRVPVQGHRRRALLAVLLLDANRVVSFDRLITSLWGEDPPGDAAAALQVAVFRLRRALVPGGAPEDGPVRTTSAGYVIRVGPDELDLSRFERLVAEGRHALADGHPTRASASLTEALSLWRGEPLAEFAGDQFAQPEAVRLEELRLTALEDRLEADLALGRHGDVIGEIRRLSAMHPFRERLHVQSALALYRCGRQAEALDALQGARRRLAEELGIDPSATVRTLETAILHQDPSLDWVPPAVPAGPAAPGEGSPPSGSAERRLVTVVFAQIVPAAVVPPDPESVRPSLARAFALVRAAFERHGGAVSRELMDDAVATFGAPATHEDDAVRAARGALEAVSSIEALNGELTRDGRAGVELRAGVASAQAMFVDGQGVRGDEHIRGSGIGHALNAAVALASGTEPGQVLLDEATFRLAGGGVTVEMLGGGRAGPAFRLLDVVPVGSPRARRYDSPLVGRTSELAALQMAFTRTVADGTCVLCTVTGDPGVGKSRLVEEFLGSLGASACVLRGRCLPYGTGITFRPVAEVLKGAVGVRDGDPPERVKRALARILGPGGEMESVADQLTDLMGTGGTASPEEASWAFRRLLETLGARRPLVVVFEDVHWGEAAFLDLVEHLARWSEKVSLLLVCLARSELLQDRSEWGHGAGDVRVSLEPLTDEDSRALLGNLLRGGAIDDEVASAVATTAEGVPLFVEELVTFLLDEGLLARSGDRWSAAPQLSAAPMPPSIHALLSARLHQLTPEQRAVVEAGAVEGKQFHPAAVAALLGSPVPDVRAHLGALVRLDVIRPAGPEGPGEGRFGFRHQLIRDCAYALLPKGRRAELHERLTEWLEGAPGEHSAEDLAVAGYHMERAHAYLADLGNGGEHADRLGRRAAELLGSAGGCAARRGDVAGAANLLSRAIALLTESSGLRFDLLAELAWVSLADGDFEGARTAARSVLESGSWVPDAVVRGHAHLADLMVSVGSDPRALSTAESTETASSLLSLFESRADDLGIARALRLLVDVDSLHVRYREVPEKALRILRAAGRSGHAIEQMEGAKMVLLGLVYGPTPVSQALSKCRSLQRAVGGRPLVRAPLVVAEALLTAMDGHPDAARERCREGLRAVRESSGAALQAECVNLVGDVEMLAGEWQAAEVAYGEACDTLRRMGEHDFFSTVAAMRGRALARLGRFDEAEDVALAGEAAGAKDDVATVVISGGVRARVAAARGRFDEAETLAARMVALVPRDQAPVLAGWALTDLAEVLEMAGRRDEAEAALREAIALFEAKGDVADRRLASIRLAEIIVPATLP